MPSIKSASLAKTLKYLSNTDKQFKYEIYQSSDGANIFAISYMLIELLEGSEVWVWSVLDEEIILLSGGQHPDYADQKAREHFNSNYVNE